MESIQGDREPTHAARRLQDTQRTPAVPTVVAPPRDRRAGGRGRRRAVAITAAVVVLAAGAGIGAWLATSGDSPRSGSGTLVVTRTVRVVSGTMAETVSSSGTIQPAQEASLNFAVSGRVTAVDVKVGTMVKAGQPLAQVSPTALQAQEAAAQSALTSAQAKLAADEASGANSTQVAADEAAVASAQSQLTTAKKSLAEATLTSTITGEVSDVNLTVGEQVSGAGSDGSTSSSPTRVYGPGAGTSGASGQVTVVSPNRFIVDCSVDDTEVAQLAKGDPVIVSQTGTPVSVPGRVTFLGLVPSGTGIPSYPVTVTLTGTPAGVYAGTDAKLAIVVQRRHHVLEVPTPAVSYHGGQAFVDLELPGGREVTRRVTVGTTLNGETAITGGLTAGQRVVERLETFRVPATRGRKTTSSSPPVRRAVTSAVGSGPAPVAVPGG